MMKKLENIFKWKELNGEVLEINVSNNEYFETEFQELIKSWEYWIIDVIREWRNLFLIKTTVLWNWDKYFDLFSKLNIISINC